MFAATLGCDKNLVDSEALLGRFAARGLRVTQDPDEADVWVLNTCGFIEAARRDSMDAIARMCEEKGDRLLVVTGCLTQERGEEIRRDYPAIDLVSGIGNFDQVVQALTSGEDMVPVGRPDDARYEGLHDRPLLTPPHLAFMKISEGCNFRCSFCRIPLIRGDQRSRTVAELADEARRLAARGVRELMLVSQNTSDYGRDTGEGLEALVAELSGVPELEWVRLHYLYPGLIGTDAMRRILDTPKVLPYLDMPVQHAAPAVLKAMNRPFRTDALARFFTDLRAERPELALRTTVLLGFPGETEDDVEQVLDFLAAVRFDHVGTYRYSPEAGTSGASLTDLVDDEEVADREARVLDLQIEIARERQLTRLGGAHRLVVDRLEDAEDWRPVLEDLEDRVDDADLDWLETAETVAVARSRHQAYEMDGVVLLDGADRTPGEWLDARWTAVTPFDAAAAALDPGKDAGS
ncbi:30S ribosomal protein S12 methylthiotransferase RimO [bacterium]|nr:30S ribosomal protein S12 methylthiotransferase RimO [bacterium]